MADLGMQLSQMYLSPFDHIIGIIGDAGAGKSLLIKGMFPGIDLTNDDEGVNIRPLPLLHEDLTDPFSPHTYHLDIRFESAFTQMHVLADTILDAANHGKQVIVEHFDLIYPMLHRNADLLVGIGEEIIITRPNMFGPLPENIANIVHKSVNTGRWPIPWRICACTIWETALPRTARVGCAPRNSCWSLRKSRMWIYMSWRKR